MAHKEAPLSTIQNCRDFISAPFEIQEIWAQDAYWNWHWMLFKTKTYRSPNLHYVNTKLDHSGSLNPKLSSMNSRKNSPVDMSSWPRLSIFPIVLEIIYQNVLKFGKQTTRLWLQREKNPYTHTDDKTTFTCYWASWIREHFYWGEKETSQSVLEPLGCLELKHS